jgi:hypothetical protein
MKVIINEGRVIATALDDYTVQGWEQDVLNAPDGLAVENMHQWVYADGMLTYPAAELARTERNLRLSECDWVVVKSAETGEAIPTEWTSYRQALRDVTAQEGFPNTVVWPVKP